MQALVNCNLTEYTALPLLCLHAGLLLFLNSADFSFVCNAVFQQSDTTPSSGSGSKAQSSSEATAAPNSQTGKKRGRGRPKGSTAAAMRERRAAYIISQDDTQLQLASEASGSESDQEDTKKKPKKVRLRLSFAFVSLFSSCLFGFRQKSKSKNVLKRNLTQTSKAEPRTAQIIPSQCSSVRCLVVFFPWFRSLLLSFVRFNWITADLIKLVQEHNCAHGSDKDYEVVAKAFNAKFVSVCFIHVRFRSFR